MLRLRRRLAVSPGPAEPTDHKPLMAAVRAAGQFNHAVISPASGLLAAIPVGVVLGAGIATGDAVAGVTMGAGAMLVGVAWRVSGGRPPLAVMTLDAVVMALATFLGSVTGSILWLHLLMLCLWSLMGGLLVGVGNRGGVVGTQAIIAAIVFGRFSEPALAALGLAGLVLAGGLAQVVFLTVIRWPSPLRVQRRATAAAYRALAEVAGSPEEASTLAAGAALDEAADSLAAPSLLGDTAVMTLRALVSEGHRLRIALAALQTLRRQQQALGDDADPAVEAAINTALASTATALTLAAQAIEGDEGAAAQLPQTAAAMTEATDAIDGTDPVSLHVERRLAALAGQLRAIASLAPAAGQAGGLRSRRPQRRTSEPAERVRGDLAQIGANMSLRSPVGRHALRLAVVVPIAVLIARSLPLSRSYWLTVAAATVLRPEFGATFQRGTERALGTGLGVLLAGAIAVGLHPAGGVTVVLVFILAWAAYATFPASFAVGFAFITALIVFLLNALYPDTLATASARLLDTLIGGALGLVVYALWPTWARVPAWQAVADLLAAERTYVFQVLDALVAGRRPGEGQMRPLSRRVRLARTTAEATVARSLSEPATRRIDARRSQGILGALRRLAQATHVLRLDVEEERERLAMPELTPMRDALDELLGAAETTVRATDQPAQAPIAPPRPLPDLRGAYRDLQRAHGEDAQVAALLPELDEIVDSTNGLAVLSGLGSVDVDEPPPPPTPDERPRRRRRVRLPASVDRVLRLGRLRGQSTP